MSTYCGIIIIVFLIFQTMKLSVKAHRGLTTSCYKVSPLLTTSSGAPIENQLNSESAGLVGPLLLQDLALVESLAHFTRERIPPRVMHAKGAGAFGTFTVTDKSFSKYCSASLFSQVGKTSNVVVRFSNFAQERGSCDTVRGLQGAAIKFYTDDGNFDLVGHNSPIFFIRDPMLYPSLVHSLQRHPASNLHNAITFWDFMSHRPETTHQLLFMFSDRGLPDGYRHMNIHMANTYKVANATRHSFYCKFHFKVGPNPARYGFCSVTNMKNSYYKKNYLRTFTVTQANQGLKNINTTRAQQLCGSDPDYYSRDLYNSISDNEFPSWTMYYQIMTFVNATTFKWNPFDVTKVWPQSQYPLHEIGKLKLDRNPANYFAEIEQAAFSPSNLVPGIEPSPDRILQGRFFAYPDAQRYRLGANYNQLPVNTPFQVKVTNNQRDGKMCFGRNQAGSPNYWPNRDPKSAKPCLAATPSLWRLPEGYVARYNSDDQDNFEQSVTFWNEVLNEDQKKSLVASLGNHLKHASKDIQKRVIKNFENVSEDLAQRLSTTIGLK